jgi:hypothetical protein
LLFCGAYRPVERGLNLSLLSTHSNQK